MGFIEKLGNFILALVCEGVFCANFVPLAYKNRPYC